MTASELGEKGVLSVAIWRIEEAIRSDHVDLIP